MAFVNFMVAFAATRPFDKDILRVVNGGDGAAGGRRTGGGAVKAPSEATETGKRRRYHGTSALPRYWQWVDVVNVW